MFEGCLKQINIGMKSVRPTVYEIVSQKIFNFTNDGFPNTKNATLLDNIIITSVPEGGDLEPDANMQSDKF